MANQIQLKSSTVSGNFPVSLLQGEIALNEADGKLFYRKQGVIKNFLFEGHTHTAAQISDSSAYGQSLLIVASAAAARSLLGPWLNGAEQIGDTAGATLGNVASGALEIRGAGGTGSAAIIFNRPSQYSTYFGLVGTEFYYGGASEGASKYRFWTEKNFNPSNYATLANPAFTGTPSAPTAAAGTSTTQLATTAFVTSADNLKANIASPTFTGTATANILNAAMLAGTSIGTTDGTYTTANIANHTGTGTGLQISASGANGTAGSAAISFVRQGVYGVWFGIDTDNDFKFGGWSEGVASYRLWTAKNFDPTLKANLTSPTFTGTTTIANLSVSGTIYFFSDIYSYRSGAPSTGLIQLGNTGKYLYFDGTRFNFNTDLTVLGALYVGTTLSTTSTGSTIGYSTLNSGGSTRTGYLAFFAANNARQGYIGYGLTGGEIQLQAESSGGYFNFTTVGGALGPKINGSDIWCAGNFNPATKADLTMAHAITNPDLAPNGFSSGDSSAVDGTARGWQFLTMLRSAGTIGVQIAISDTSNGLMYIRNKFGTWSAWTLMVTENNLAGLSS